MVTNAALPILVFHVRCRNLLSNSTNLVGDFKGNIIKGTRTNLTRLILEAKEIQAAVKQGDVLNSKSEYRGTKLIRMTPQVQRW